MANVRTASSLAAHLLTVLVTWIETYHYVRQAKSIGAHSRTTTMVLQDGASLLSGQDIQILNEYWD